MEHVIASYLRQVWDKYDWLYEVREGFTSGYSCENQVIAVCQDIVESLDNWDMIDPIIVDFPKSFDLVPYSVLLTKIANPGVDSMEVVWISELILGRTQRFKLGGQLSAEVRVTSGVPQ